MLVIPPLLLLLSAFVVCEKKISWTQELPSGWVLNNGDRLRLPLDEYVSLSSAIFHASDPTKNKISPKLNVTHQAKSNGGNDMSSCSIAKIDQDFAYYVCGSYLHRIAKNQNFLVDQKDDITSIELTADETLTKTKTFCTDYMDIGESLVLNCYQRGTQINTNFIFSGYPKAFGSKDTFNFTKCPSAAYAQGDSKMVRVLTENNRASVFFYDASRTTNIGPGIINLLYCDLRIGSDAAPDSHKKDPNLYDKLGNEELSKGVLKYVYSTSTTEILAFIAIDEPQVNKLYIVPFNIDFNGEISKSSKSHYVWTGANIEGFNPRYMTFTAVSGTEYLASDKTNLYRLLISTTNKVTLTEPVWYSVVDCGVSQDNSIYVSSIKITDINKKLDDPNSRTIITYSEKTEFKMKEFAVHFNGTRFGCSRSTKEMNSSQLSNPNTVSFDGISLDTLIVSEDRLLSQVKLNYNTLLEIAIPAETSTQNVVLTVKMDGYTQPETKTLVYKTLKNALDANLMESKISSFKAYKDTKFTLAIVSSSFQVNNPTFTTPNNQNVKIRYAMNIKPTFKFEFGGYSKISRILAIDGDTFLAIVSKTPQDPEGFIRFWGTWNGETMTPFESSGGVTQLKKNQIVFKSFKLGPAIFCLIFKGSGIDSSRLSLSCYEDKVNGEILPEANDVIISNDYEFTDVQIMESSNRVDMFMIGIKTTLVDTKLLTYYIDLDSNGKVKTPSSRAEEINISKEDLSKYYPTDVMFDFYGDSYSGSYITVKMVSKFGLPPLITKFSVSYSASSIPVLNYAYSARLPSVDVAFCGIKNEIIFFTPKRKEILIHKMVRGKNGVTLPQNDLYLPLAEFSVKYVQQFNCIPEKGFFQVLALKDGGKKILITFRGGDSTNAATRVHSVVDVADQVNFIESTTTPEYVMTIANQEGDNTKERNFVFIYQEGPLFVVDNNGKNDNYDIGIEVSNSQLKSQGSIKVEVIQSKLKAEISPKNKFEIEIEKTIFLDDVANIQGPVMDIKVEGSDADKVTVTKRNNKNKGFTGGESTTPDRIYVESDFMVSVWEGKKVKIFGDPAISKKADATLPEEIRTLSVNVREVGLVKLGGSNGVQAVMVLRAYDGNSYTYSLYHLNRVASSGQTPYTYSAVESKDLFKTNMDFDSLQIIGVSNDDVVIALKVKRSFNSNYIKLVSFKRSTGDFYTKSSEALISTDAMNELGHHSLTTDNKGNAYIVSYFKNIPGLLLAKWNLSEGPVYFTQSRTKFKFSDSDFRMLTVNHLRCWPKTDGNFECFVDSEGVVDYMFDVIPDHTAAPGAEPIQSLTKIYEFEMPPNFDIHRIDRGKEHLGFLLRRSPYYTSSSRRILESSSTIDKFTDCNNIIVVFKPSTSKYIYTGITCSQWGGNSKVDFSMEYDTSEYVFFTRTPPAQTSRILQGGSENRITSNFISPILVTPKAALDPNNVKFSFVGLGGQGDSNIPSLTLNDFKVGKKPDEPPKASSSSFWMWFIIILVILLIVGGGIYALIWYKNNNSTESSSYLKTDFRGSLKSEELDDTRL